MLTQDVKFIKNWTSMHLFLHDKTSTQLGDVKVLPDAAMKQKQRECMTQAKNLIYLVPRVLKIKSIFTPDKKVKVPGIFGKTKRSRKRSKSKTKINIFGSLLKVNTPVACREHPHEKDLNMPILCRTYMVSFLDERDCIALPSSFFYCKK